MQFIGKIYGVLLSNKISLSKYIGITFLAGSLPAIFLSAFIFICADFLGLNYTNPPKLSISWETFWISIVFSPIIETYLLILTLYILRSFKFDGVKLAIIAALFWGMLHGVQSRSWFFSPAWGFFILSIAYETWRLTTFKKAFAAAAIPHVLHNTFAMLATGLDS
jgi:hypothetical protein